MKDFTEITLCPEALDRSKVGLGVWVLLMVPTYPPAGPQGATLSRCPTDRVLQPRF